MKRICSKAMVAAATLLCVSAISSAYAEPEREPIYISPNNDGVQDALEIPLRIKEKRYVKDWALVIRDADGSVVRVVANKRKDPERLTFLSFFRALLRPKSGVDVPATVAWNGFLGDEAADVGLTPGSVAPDGEYTYEITATDDNGNVGVTNRFPIVVDNTPPEAILAELDEDEKHFGEGDKTMLPIAQEGSVEELWTAAITDADGNAVRTFSWKDSAPESIEWDGANDAGMIVEDGVYTYSITSTDRAGNVADRTQMTNIVFSAEKPEIAIAINGSKYFSPNESSDRRSVAFDVAIPTPKSKVNALAAWSLRVLDAKGAAVYEVKGDPKKPASSFEWNGRGNVGAYNKKLVADGQYHVELAARYRNGYAPAPVSSPDVVLDGFMPEAKVAPKEDIFNGQSSLEITQKQTGSDPAYDIGPKTWVGELKRIDEDADTETVVRRYEFGSNLPASILWDGSTDQGHFADDGLYCYELTVSTLAGNSNTYASKPFELDTSTTELMLSVSPEAFSPNGDNVQDTVTFRPVAKAVSGIAEYTLTISNEAGEAVRTFSGTNTLPSTVTWDGRTEGGAVAADGRYAASLKTTARSGTESEPVSQYFVLDTQKPEIDVSALYTAFSPDGLPAEVSRKQVVPVKMQSSKENKWTLAIADRDGNAVRSIDVHEGDISSLLDADGEFKWNGTDDMGNKAADGVYVLTVSSTDAAGNSNSAILSDIVLDTRETKAYVTAAETGVSPNGDGVLDVQKFTIRSTLTDGVASWRFEIVSADGAVVRRWTEKDGPLPAAVEWTGDTMGGASAEGIFMGRLHVEYVKGNVVDAASSSFVCTTVPPRLRVISSANPDEGSYFSPDNDGNEDELTMVLGVETLSSVKSWTLSIKDSLNSKNDAVFWRTSGKSMGAVDGSPNSYASSIKWDGRGNNGEMVMSAEDYPYEFTVTDELGMSSTYQGIVPVDVLVVLDGGRLKMQVPSIVFRGDAADFLMKGEVGPDGKVIARSSVTREQRANNERVLARIAQILKKFSNYKVTVVGHANPTNKWNGPEERNPEENEDGPWGRALVQLSKERAEYVKTWLVKEGKVSSSRLSTEGKGGLETIASRTDTKNRWKNRRVEFILEK